MTLMRIFTALITVVWSELSRPRWKMQQKWKNVLLELSSWLTDGGVCAVQHQRSPMMLFQCLSMLVTIEKAQTLECGCHKLYIYPFKLHSELWTSLLRLGCVCTWSRLPASLCQKWRSSGLLVPWRIRAERRPESMFTYVLKGHAHTWFADSFLEIWRNQGLDWDFIMQLLLLLWPSLVFQASIHVPLDMIVSISAKITMTPTSVNAWWDMV